MQMKVFVPMWALEAQTASGTSLAECLDEPVSRTLSMLGAQKNDIKESTQ